MIDARKTQWVSNMKLWVFSLLVVLPMAGCVSVKTADNQNYEPSYPQARKVQPMMNGSIFNADSSRPLFEDIKARYVGDILTVVLVEKTDAKKSANTETTKETTGSAGPTTLFGRTLGTDTNHDLLTMGTQSSNEFTGEGDSDQSNSLTGTIAVTVAEVLPNGNLFVRGQKRVHINQGDEFIKISGIIRSADVRQDNTISSTLIADAQITYSGSGAIADSNSMGWITRFFNSPLWPL
ncbi:MAG: flagellar basal body L-ring protein FlgH [Gammaproteobacteria bacterium]|nr:flagellar basal body L-ring protein FlgH [Gammaproteobacteria bacterium]